MQNRQIMSNTLFVIPAVVMSVYVKGIESAWRLIFHTLIHHLRLSTIIKNHDLCCEWALLYLPNEEEEKDVCSRHLFRSVFAIFYMSSSKKTIFFSLLRIECLLFVLSKETMKNEWKKSVADCLRE